MDSVNATQLKNRLGPVLARAALAPVAIVRYGRVIAYLVPVEQSPVAPSGRVASPTSITRAQEERLVDLCARGDFRPSRWLRAGNTRTLAGVATMLASQPEFDRPRLLALAERLHPGMTLTQEFGKWLVASRVRPARFLPMVRARRAELERSR